MKNQLTEIRQDNTITLARYDYTALEINLMTLIFEQVNKYGDSDYVTYQLDLTVLYKLTGFDRSHLTRIKEALKNIRAKFFEFYDKEEMIYTNAVLLSSFQIYEKKDLVIFTIDPFMRPMLFKLVKSSTRYYRESILCIAGKSSKRIYHMCSMFKNNSIGEPVQFDIVKIKDEKPFTERRGTTSKGFSIEVDRLKDKLYVDRSKYTNSFSMFEQRIILPAIDQINTFSDLWVGYEKVKQGRTVTDIRFYVLMKENKQDEVRAALTDEDAAKVFKILTEEFLLPGHMTENAIQTVGLENLRQLIYKTRINDQVRNKGAYIAVTLETMGVSRNKFPNEYEDNNG